VHLRHGGQLSCLLVHYEFVLKFSSERNFKMGEHLVKLRAKWLIVSCALFAFPLSHLKMPNR